MKKYFTGKHGQSLIELAIVLPIVITFIFVFFEVSLFFLTNQKVAYLTRDAAFRAFKYCQAAGADTVTMDACLDANVISSLEGEAGRAFSDFSSKGKIMISVYKWPGTAPPERLSCKAGGSISTSLDCTSNTQFQTSSFSLDGGANLVEDFSLIFIGEIIYDSSSLRSTATQAVLPATTYDYSIF